MPLERHYNDRGAWVPENNSSIAAVNEGVGPMATIAHGAVLTLYGDLAAAVANAIGSGLKKLERGLNEAFEAPARREVDRKIALVLERSGGRLTDSVEREIARTLLQPD
jgi:hypothetical protein